MNDAARIPPRLESAPAGDLGAHAGEEGVAFAIFSAHASAVELCLFDAAGERELARLPMPECTQGVWHGFLPQAGPGLVYGYRVHGPYEPARGARFNPNKLLVDPYARAFAGRFAWSDAHYGYRVGEDDLTFDARDNAAGMLKGRVVAPGTAGEAPRRPATPWPDTVVYELHVKGWSVLDERLPAALRGTYAGLAHPASIETLRRLGVTAVELLPVAEMVDEHRLHRQGLVNYWGYNSIGFFSPAARYAAGPDPLAEFRDMVARLHAAGLEVILDVVYNHTAETDEFGPTLAFRGLDNASYYRLRDGGRRYDDATGCGNTLDFGRAPVRALALDSLRWWHEALGVDGFRFDLATAIARDGAGFDPASRFLAELAGDPRLAAAKLIVEPWDATGCHTGAFPAPYAEWNDRFRDTARGFWLTREAGCGELAARLAGSSAVFRHGGRPPQASINFVTAHDGFTMADLVAYREKHNEANGERNADGAAGNRSVNNGAEGPTGDAAILERRGRLVRALFATLFVAQGVPMVVAGDEHGRTQRGNNNAYCQDNDLSWVDRAAGDGLLRDWVERLVALRRRHPALRRARWLDGTRTAMGEAEVAWLAPDGAAMTPARWDDPGHRAFAMLLGRDGADEAALLVLVNGHDDARRFALPPPVGGSWRVALCSATAGDAQPPPGGPVEVPALAVWILESRGATP